MPPKFRIGRRLFLRLLRSSMVFWQLWQSLQLLTLRPATPTTQLKPTVYQTDMHRSVVYGAHRVARDLDLIVVETQSDLGDRELINFAASEDW